MKKRNIKINIITTVMMMIFILIGVNAINVAKQQRLEEQQRVYQKMVDLRLDPQSIKDDTIHKVNSISSIKDDLDKAMKKDIDYLTSAEYKHRKFIDELKTKYSIESDAYEIFTVQLSFYSDLNCENGFGNLTATGDTLSAGHVANNQLPFDTKVYMQGYGMKVVKDRGSYKHFNEVNKFDVFVPRNGGESDSDYYRRVNNMGRVSTMGIIFK